MEDLSTEIQIRRYRHPMDYQAAYHVWESCGDGIHISFSDSPQELEKLVNISPGLFFLAEDHGKVIGTVMGGFDGRRGLIYHLAVLPEYQNHHIGSLLLNTVEDALVKRGCKKIYLFLVPENLERAGFYENKGYDRMNVIPFTKIIDD